MKMGRGRARDHTLECYSLHFLVVDNMLGNKSVSSTRVLPLRVFGGSATL